MPPLVLTGGSNRRRVRVWHRPGMLQVRNKYLLSDGQNGSCKMHRQSQAPGVGKTQQRSG